MRMLLLVGVAVLVVQLVSAAAAALPGSDCQTKCGNFDIPYPFGIGKGCAMEGFELLCNKTEDGGFKPFIINVEVLNISLVDGRARVLNQISMYCYNTTTRDMGSNEWYLNFSAYPYRFSDVHNRFTVIGCNTLAYISDETHTGYESGCASECHSPKGLTNGSCSGIGCCQTAIPEGLKYYEVSLYNIYNNSKTVDFSRCSYGVLVESAAFNFSTTYITTTKFNDTNKGRAPLVLDWAIGNETCDVAKLNKTGAYACISSNSDCVDSTNGPGYLCNCSHGYAGNPYLPSGCTDVNECDDNPCHGSGICHNTPGAYRCSCPPGRKLASESHTCKPDISLIIGVSIGFAVLVIIIFFLRVIHERRKLINIKQQYVREHGGLLLFEKMKFEQGLGFTIFTEMELQQATNNFNKSQILGKGGHGIVYKGTVKDNVSVAVKKCTLIDDRQKKEFGKEMLILSHINHKNIVKILGCCLEVEVPMLVYEFIPHGTLFDLLHGKHSTLHIPFSALLRIAHETAEGLAFLHSYATPPIMHGDVKTANILLDENYVAKVSDFGASILAPTDEAQFVTMIQGTRGYLDPEYMQTGQLTDKSDVYSFGVILLEILTGQMPFKLEGPELQKCLSSNFLLAMKKNKLESILNDQIKNEANIELLEAVAELARQCLDMCGDRRPSMKDVADELNRLRKFLQHPWIGHNPEETETLLSGSSITSFEMEAISTGYQSLEKNAKLQINLNTAENAR